MTPIIAGIDLATVTGVAVGPLGGRPDLRTVDLGTGQPHEARFSAALSLVFNLVKVDGVTHIALEAPVQAGRHSQAQNELSMGLSAIVRGWAYRQGALVERASPQTIAKAFIGHGGLPRADKKAAVIAACERRGWAPDDDNQADAAAAWDWMCCRLSPAYAANTAGMFAKVA